MSDIVREIEIHELEIIFKKIISKLKSEDLKILKFKSDFYRIIPTDIWDSYDENIICEASLYDDIDCLNIFKRDSNRTFTYVDFDRVASVLRAISEQNNPASTSRNLK